MFVHYSEYNHTESETKSITAGHYKWTRKKWNKTQPSNCTSDLSIRKAELLDF